MNPWITGRIIEQMQADARESAHQSRLHRDAMAQRRQAAADTREPRRERLGLAVARVGLRIAGRSADATAARQAFASPKLEATR
jgi:hypothetical protein